MDGYSASETEGSVEICWNLLPANITFERTVGFFVSTQPGSAVESDYISLNNTLLSPTDQNEICVRIEVTSDLIIENAEDFTVELLSSDSAIHFTSSSVEVCCIRVL